MNSSKNSYKLPTQIHNFRNISEKVQAIRPNSQAKEEEEEEEVFCFKMTLLWVVASCTLVEIDRSYGSAHYLQHQGVALQFK
jgi:hypothetical protein